jgi:DNA-binding transcriptional LysR family regulator
MTPTVELRLLEIFYYVYQTRSFSRAAQRLDLSQPTISGHIKSIEGHFGVLLFDRKGRTIEATDAGHLLYRKCDKLIELQGEAVNAMDRFLNRFEGRLHLGASNIPGEYILPPLLSRFHGRYPKIQVTLHIQGSQRTLEKVESGEVSVGFVGGLSENDLIHAVPFASDELVPVCSPQLSELAATESLTLDQLKRVAFVAREPGSGTRTALDRRLRDCGMRLDDLTIVAELGSNTAILEAVKAGVGMSMLSSLSIARELSAGDLRTIRIDQFSPLERRFFRVTSRQRTSSPLLEAFIGFLDEQQDA